MVGKKTCIFNSCFEDSLLHIYRDMSGKTRQDYLTEFRTAVSEKKISQEEASAIEDADYGKDYIFDESFRDAALDLSVSH